MHEFSIIQHIVDIVKNTALQNKISSVRRVELEVGSASGVISEAMQFAWQSVKHDPLLCEASLNIVEIPLRVKCANCSFVYSPDEIYEPCPSCTQINPEILQGKELRVIAIET